MPNARSLSWAFALMIATPTAHAANWLVCDIRIEVRKVDATGITAGIIGLPHHNPPACKTLPAALHFMPETPDYQSILPKRRWPQPGGVRLLRYRELTGLCKNDGNTQPCTIRHYSLMPVHTTRAPS